MVALVGGRTACLFQTNLCEFEAPNLTPILTFATTFQTNLLRIVVTTRTATCSASTTVPPSLGGVFGCSRRGEFRAEAYITSRPHARDARVSGVSGRRVISGTERWCRISPRRCLTTGDGSDVVEIPSALLDFHLLRAFVVMLIEYFTADVHSIADDLLGHVVRQEVSDRPSSDVVW